MASLIGVGDNAMSMFLMLSTGVTLDGCPYLPVFVAASVIPLLIIAGVVFVLGRVHRVKVRKFERRPS